MNDSSGVGTKRLLSGGENVRVNAVGGVDAAGVLAELAARQMQHRVRQVAVVDAALVLELAHVEGEHDVQRLHAGEALLQVFAVPLHARAERPEVHAVRADADRAAPAAGAERQDLVERVEQHRPLLGLERAIRVAADTRRSRLGEPDAEIGKRLVLERRIGVDFGEAGASKGERIHTRPRERTRAAEGAARIAYV